MESSFSEEYKSLLALNSSLATRLEEHAGVIRDRDKEITMLQSMLTESNAYRSNLDNQVYELQEVQQSIKQLQQQLEGTSYIGTNTFTGTAISMDQQVGNLKFQYTYLQTQLNDLQKQLVELNKRNAVLQQQTSRIAELESLLQNATDEIAALQSKISNRASDNITII